MGPWVGHNVRNGAITNEYAYWSPEDAKAHLSDTWEMTSGSLLAKDGAAWTGVPADIGPNAESSNGTSSAIFRLTTKSHDLDNVKVAFKL